MREGSPGAPRLNDAVPGGGPYGPAAAVACPLVSIIPLVIDKRVPVTVNVPLATAGHVSEGFKIVTPGPASVAASVAAEPPGVTRS